jgi:hypothetical protein
LAEEVTSLLITGLKLSLEFSSVLMLPLWGRECSVIEHMRPLCPSWHDMLSVVTMTTDWGQHSLIFVHCASNVCYFSVQDRPWNPKFHRRVLNSVNISVSMDILGKFRVQISARGPLTWLIFMVFLGISRQMFWCLKSGHYDFLPNTYQFIIN